MNCKGTFLNEKNKGLTEAIEMLSYVDDVCRRNNIKYTLFFTTLLSAIEEQQIAEWLQVVQIGMLYDDYVKFMSVLEKDVVHTRYYTVEYDKDNTFLVQYSRLYKRSGIVLPKHRKNDERFYDNFINIFPIYQVANTKRQLKKVQKKYLIARKYISARAITPGTIKLRKALSLLKRNYYYKNRKKYSPRDINHFLEESHSKENKYCFIPWIGKQKGVMISSDTYQNVVDIVFEGKKYMCVSCAKEWLRCAYSTKTVKKLKEQKKNVVLQQGTETLRRVQLVALDILIEFDRICRKNDIKYILGAGTLLGAVRHKGFIPWDDDIDIYMLHEEWKKFEKICESELDHERFFVRTQETDIDDNLCFFQIKRNNTIYCKEGRAGYNTHRGVFIDIFPFFNGANNIISHKVQNRLCKWLKTITWAHMGAQSERKYFKRKWYEFLQNNISNKKSFELFYKLANRYPKSKFLCFLYVKRNPYKKGVNQRKYFEDLIELEFENHMFYAPREYHELLVYLYSKDYTLFPSVAGQCNHHFPADIELGDLHMI